MVEKFLRLFSAHRELERQAESDAALIESLNRYIGALEGRDGERLATIEALELSRRECLETIRELKSHLSGILPGRKEEAME